MLQLIELLEHPTLSEAAIAAFDVLSLEFPQLHLPVIKHLFKQKLFQICLKGLWHKLESYSEKHLSAFVFVLRLTPHQVIKNDLPKVEVMFIIVVRFHYYSCKYTISDWTNFVELPKPKRQKFNFGSLDDCKTFCYRTK